MMPYKGTYLRLFSILLRKPMADEYGKKLTRKALKAAPAVYRQMLEKTDDIGSDNPMAGNIYMGFVFLAIWKAADGAITPDSLRRVTKSFMGRPIIGKLMGGRDINRQEDLEAAKAKFHKMQEWADAHPEYKNKTWDFNFDETKHRDGSYYHFTRCPLEKFARENGFLEVLPVACEIDYMTTAFSHGVLHRDYTLATGGPICDYWIVPDQIKDPE